MFYIRKIDDYLKILPDNEVKYSVAINFSEYFKSAREKFYFKLSEGQNLRKVAELLNLMQSNSYDNLKKQIKIIVK